MSGTVTLRLLNLSVIVPHTQTQWWLPGMGVASSGRSFQKTVKNSQKQPPLPLFLQVLCLACLWRGPLALEPTGMTNKHLGSPSSGFCTKLVAPTTSFLAPTSAKPAFKNTLFAYISKFHLPEVCLIAMECVGHVVINIHERDHLQRNSMLPTPFNALLAPPACTVHVTC